MSWQTSKISLSSCLSSVDKLDPDLNIIFPKKLPELTPGPVYDESGFTLNERLALRQAWSVIKPFERRYGKEIYFDFLMEHYKTFENFRFDGKIDLFRLHKHSLTFMRFVSSIIEERDPVALQILLSDNYTLHRRANVKFDYLLMIIKALIKYVLEKLKDVSSASLESGFQRLYTKFQLSMIESDKTKNITFKD